MSASLPTSLTELGNELRASGFSESEKGDVGAFGDWWIDLSRGRVVVRFEADRGEWSIRVGNRDWDELFDVGLWRGVLDPSIDLTEPLEAETAALFVSDGLDRLVELAEGSSSPSTHAQLRELGNRRAQALFGIAPDAS